MFQQLTQNAHGSAAVPNLPMTEKAGLPLLEVAHAPPLNLQ